MQKKKNNIKEDLNGDFCNEAGERYGLTGQAMNAALKKLGYVCYAEEHMPPAPVLKCGSTWPSCEFNCPKIEAHNGRKE